MGTDLLHPIVVAIVLIYAIYASWQNILTYWREALYYLDLEMKES